jgi:hypothetical protein
MYQSIQYQVIKQKLNSLTESASPEEKRFLLKTSDFLCRAEIAAINQSALELNNIDSLKNQVNNFGKKPKA